MSLNLSLIIKEPSKDDEKLDDNDDTDDSDFYKKKNHSPIDIIYRAWITKESDILDNEIICKNGII